MRLDVSICFNQKHSLLCCLCHSELEYRKEHSPSRSCFCLVLVHTHGEMFIVWHPFVSHYLVAIWSVCVLCTLTLQLLLFWPQQFFSHYFLCMLMIYYRKCFGLIYQLLYLMVLPFDSSSSRHPDIFLFLVSLFSVYAFGFAPFGVLLQLALIARKFFNDLKQLESFKESSVEWRHSLFHAFDKNEKLFLSFV